MILTVMKISVGQLRELFRQGLEEGKVGIHPDYQRKEHIREQLQKMITDGIAAGNIKDQQGVDDFIATVGMAMEALKMVPFEVYSKIAASKT